VTASVRLPRHARERTAERQRKSRKQAAARMRKMRRLRRADLMRFEFHVSKKKLRKIALAREDLDESVVLSEKFLRQSLLRGIAVWGRIWLRRYETRKLRVTSEASSAVG
jgi:hypothetical protein